MTPATPTWGPGRRESVVSCAIGDEQYAVRGTDACEIVRAERLRRVAGADGSIGTLTVAGEAVPVYSLASVLGRPGKTERGLRGDGNHVVVTRSAAGAVGWLVDRIVRSALPEDARVMALPDFVGPVAHRWFEGVLQVDERALLLLAPEHLDPRLPSDPPAPGRDTSVPHAESGRTVRDEPGAPLVVIFASPALPHAGVGKFALSGRRVAAVTRALPFIVLPGSAPQVTGLMVWRDAAVPVVDVRNTRSHPTRTAERYLIARCSAAANRALVAFAVTAQVSLHEPTRADRLVEERIDVLPSFVTGVFGVGGERVALLDLDALLAALTAGPEQRAAAAPPATSVGQGPIGEIGAADRPSGY